MRSFFFAAFCLSASVVDARKKKKKKKGPPLTRCVACEHIARELQKSVKQQVRLKFLGETEPPYWADWFNVTCARGGLEPFCDEFVRDSTDGVVAFADGLLERNTDASEAEAELKLSAIRRALCGAGGVLDACHPKHFFWTREHDQAVDVWVRNDGETEVKVVFLRHGKDRSDESAFGDDAVVGTIAPGETWRHESMQAYAYRFLAPGQEWRKGVDLMLGPAGHAKFEAFAYEPRLGYVELNKPAMIPQPGAEMPGDWDEDEDGPWDPILTKNPDLTKRDTPFHLRRLDEAEL